MFIRYYGVRGRKGVNWEIIVKKSESEEWNKRCYALIDSRTRWVLDHLEYLPTYRVVSDKSYETLLRKQEEYFRKKKTKNLKNKKN